MENRKAGLGRVLQIAGKRKRLLFVSAAMAVGHALLTIVPYWLVYAIIRELLTPPIDLSLIRTYIGWAVLAVVPAYVLLYVSGVISHIAAYNILYGLRRQMAEKLGRLPLGFVTRQNSGVLKKILVDDVERIENVVAHSIPDLAKALALPLVTLAYLFTVDWRLALSSCIPILLLALIIPVLFNRQRKDLIAAYHGSLEDMNAAIVEFVRAMPVMKIFGRTADSFDKYSNAVTRFRQMVLEWNNHASPSFSIFISFISNATLPVVALGFYLYFSGGLTLPVFFLFLILGVGYIRPLFALPNLGSQLTVIIHGVTRLDDVLNAEEQLILAEKEPGPDSGIVFENVSFSYEGSRSKALDNVSFHAPQGTITALVGPSGSGKTTAAQLVARFWDVSRGQIRVGEQNICHMRPDTLMEQIAFVFQDSFLFQESLYENIRMGMDKNDADIIQAAKAAQCHEFITRLPAGYQTRWGAAGVQLSGGEQQRIQLARAILKDAPILILDEATAFSDPENEYLIQQALSKLIHNKTVIIIAHRLSTITGCDQIVALDKGRVAGKGRHKELLETCPLYQTMWNAHTRAGQFAIADHDHVQSL